MTSKDILKQIIMEQAEDLNKTPIELLRLASLNIELYVKTPHVIVIQGIRRAGKSTFLQQIRNSYYLDNSYYFSFEDERLVNFTVDDFNLLYETLLELYGEKQTFFLDEIQNIDRWETFVRRMHDRGYKFFITGSNASMLSKELGTRLTGRSLFIEMFPFSFLEYLDYQNLLGAKDVHITTNKELNKNKIYTTKTQAMLQRYFNEYLRVGGLPEYLRFGTGEILHRLYDDILYRDIIVRNEVSAIKEIRELGIYLFGNIASLISFNKLKQMLNLGSVNTIKKFIQYFEDSYLIFTVNRFSYSIKQQMIAPKKIYGIDTGLINHLGFKFSENLGHLLENFVFLELKRRKAEIYYYKTANNLEVDFLLRQGTQITQLIQVSQSLLDEATRKREVTSLLEAMHELDLKTGLILTLNEENIQLDNKAIEVKPIYRWLLEQS